MKFKGEWALVTGAGRGIGRSIALSMSKEGASVVVVDIDAERARGVAEEIVRDGGKASSYKMDIADAKDIVRVFGEVEHDTGGIEILANVAGVMGRSGTLDTTEEEWDRVMAVNFKGVFLCCREALKYMVPKRKGRIVNIGSIAGKRGGGLLGTTSYAASKAGVIGLTKALAREFASAGINVNCVCPGLTITDMTRELFEKNREFCLRQIPLGRPGTPEGVAKAVVFLASLDADYITGETLDVDGGTTMD